MSTGLRISVGAISEYRKQFFAAVKERATASPEHAESDTVESVSRMSSESGASYHHSRTGHWLLRESHVRKQKDKV